MRQLVDKLYELLNGFLPELDVSIKLGVIGAALILVFFLIGLALSAGSRIDKYRRQLLGSIKTLNAVPYVNEENVDVLTKEIKTQPEEVQKGWARFMDQRIGYPSDYMQARDVLTRREYTGALTASKIFLIIAGLLVCVAIALIGFMKDVNADTLVSLVVSLEFLIIPVATYVITLLLLDIVFNCKVKRLRMVYMSFCELLDAKVIVKDKEEREFVSENLKEINKRVEELMAGRLADEEVVEVITAPKVEEVEELPAEEVEEPAATEEELEPLPDDVPQVAYDEMTDEEKAGYLSGLLSIVDTAIEDPRTTQETYCELAVIIYGARTSGAYSDAEAAVMDECLTRLATKISE